jgi:hypothetical protein
VEKGTFIISILPIPGYVTRRAWFLLNNQRALYIFEHPVFSMHPDFPLTIVVDGGCAGACSGLKPFLVGVKPAITTTLSSSSVMPFK